MLAKNSRSVGSRLNNHHHENFANRNCVKDVVAFTYFDHLELLNNAVYWAILNINIVVSFPDLPSRFLIMRFRK